MVKAILDSPDAQGHRPEAVQHVDRLRQMYLTSPSEWRSIRTTNKPPPPHRPDTVDFSMKRPTMDEGPRHRGGPHDEVPARPRSNELAPAKPVKKRLRPPSPDTSVQSGSTISTQTSSQDQQDPFRSSQLRPTRHSLPAGSLRPTAEKTDAVEVPPAKKHKPISSPTNDEIQQHHKQPASAFNARAFQSLMDGAELNVPPQVLVTLDDRKVLKDIIRRKKSEEKVLSDGERVAMESLRSVLLQKDARIWEWRRKIRKIAIANQELRADVHAELDRLTDSVTQTHLKTIQGYSNAVREQVRQARVSYGCTR